MQRTTIALLACALLAAPATAQRIARLDAEQNRKQWTAEKILSAKPMPMPSVDLSAARERPFFESDAGRKAVTGRRGSPPTARVLPNFDRRLFPPQRLKRRRAPRPGPRAFTPRSFEPVPANSGTFGLQFSSSRLVPEDARLFYPYSAVGKVFMTRDGLTFICSGAVVSARLVVTAGHCIFDGGEFADEVIFVPAYYRGEAPYGVWEAETLVVTDSWADTEAVPNNADIGFLVVTDQDFATASGGGSAIRKIGEVTGWLGYKTGSLADNHVHMFGFPADFDQGERMHQTTSSDRDVDAAAPAVIYGGDMRGGTSGGPWVQNFGNKARGQKGGRNKQPNRVVGVSSFVSSDKKFKVIGSSVFNAEARDAFNAACAERAGNCQKKGKPRS